MLINSDETLNHRRFKLNLQKIFLTTIYIILNSLIKIWIHEEEEKI
jgi:hypothetical protein